MSDIIFNGIKLVGDETDIRKLKELIKGTGTTVGEEILVDFNKIIPMPKELDPDLNSSNKYISESIDWCYENWGCKYNATSAEYDGFDKIYFTTVNGAVFELIEKLSSLSPKIKIYYFADIDYESYCCTIQNGRILKANFRSDDAYDYEFDREYEIEFCDRFYSDSALNLNSNLPLRLL